MYFFGFVIAWNLGLKTLSSIKFGNNLNLIFKFHVIFIQCDFIA